MSGRALVGPGGLLTELTQPVLKHAQDAEMTDHLGDDIGIRPGSARANSRNGRTANTVLTGIRPVEISVARDRNGTFEPAIVPKRQRRLGGLGRPMFLTALCRSAPSHPWSSQVTVVSQR